VKLGKRSIEHHSNGSEQVGAANWKSSRVGAWKVEIDGEIRRTRRRAQVPARVKTPQRIPRFEEDWPGRVTRLRTDSQCASVADEDVLHFIAEADDQLAAGAEIGHNAGDLDQGAGKQRSSSSPGRARQHRKTRCVLPRAGAAGRNSKLLVENWVVTQTRTGC